MQAEDVRSDEALRELVVRAFDNITGLSDQISEGYLSRFFNIFHLMYPVLDEAKKNPPTNASQKMRDLLQNIVDEGETSTAPVQGNKDEGPEDTDEYDGRDMENDSDDDNDSDDNDNSDNDGNINNNNDSDKEEEGEEEETMATEK